MWNKTLVIINCLFPKVRLLTYFSNTSAEDFLFL